MARSPRLKVFQAQMGFFESVVAAPSQKAALTAWGTRQDLFKEGMAGLAEDPAVVEAALAEPGVVLQRPVGSKAPFEKPSRQSALPAVPKPPPRPKAPVKPDAPDRRPLDAAEKALANFEAQQQSKLDRLSAREAELESKLRELRAERLDTEQRLAKRRQELERALERARKAYEKAGGSAPGG